MHAIKSLPQLMHDPLLASGQCGTVVFIAGQESLEEVDNHLVIYDGYHTCSLCVPCFLSVFSRCNGAT